MEPGEEKGAPGSLKILARAEQAASATLMAAILGLVTLQVVNRYALESPFVWTEELARFGLIWLTFIGAAFVMARGRHIAVDVLSHLLGPRGRMILDIVSLLFTLAASIMFLPASFRFTRSMHNLSSSAADVPMSVVYSASLCGFGLLAFHCLIRLVVAVREGPAGYTDENAVEHIPGSGTE